MILLIDNYDSFSYNLYQLIGEIEPDIRVIRNDEMTVEEIRTLKPDRIILSPGPGRPEDAGVIIAVAKELERKSQSLACASAIRRYVQHTVRQSHMQRSSCTESNRMHRLTQKAFYSRVARKSKGSTLSFTCCRCGHDA